MIDLLWDYSDVKWWNTTSLGRLFDNITVIRPAHFSRRNDAAASTKILDYDTFLRFCTFSSSAQRPFAACLELYYIICELDFSAVNKYVHNQNLVRKSDITQSRFGYHPSLPLQGPRE